MKNKLSDLNNYLFEQIENLNDDSLSDQQLDKTIKKAEAISKISEIIIENSKVQLQAMKIAADNGIIQPQTLKTLLGRSTEEQKALPNNEKV